MRYQLAQSAWVARQLPGWLADQVDVVHLYTHNAGLLAHRALSRLPYVVTIDSTNAQSNLMHPHRDPTRFSGMSTVAVRPFERPVYANAARVVANSRWCARSLTDHYGIDRDRIELLPMGVPVPPPPAAGASVSAEVDGALLIRRTMRRKGGYDLLDVHQRWLSERCELVLVTQDPVPPAKNVIVLDDVRPGDGRVDDLLSGSAMLVLPSHLDQWPNSVMEAMSYGVPPVVSEVGGMPEMVMHG